MNVIQLDHVTKDYGNEKGIFDVSLSVKKGEVFGFLGPNGAGKTTAIRHLMGFIHPQMGTCRIMGMDCFEDASNIQKSLGYLAGEIAFLNDMKGMELLNFTAKMKGIHDKSRMLELIEMFELNPNGKVKKMSKGMKQKLGIVIAFMGNPEILILDEPTSGLDPLMQKRFIQLILEEKLKERTILMSSHMIEEIERVCDRVAIIKQGKMVAIEDVKELKEKRSRQYVITFDNKEAAEMFCQYDFDVIEQQGNRLTLSVGNNLQSFLKQLADYPVTDIETRVQSLDELFMEVYGGQRR